MSPDESARSRAQLAFVEWVELVKRGEAPERESFVARQQADAREELSRILDDYEALRRSSGALLGAPGEGRVIGDFRLLQEIGRGGMGSVWEAEQLSLGRRVALKLLHPHLTLSGPALRRFRLEAQAASRVRHPSIVAVYEVGEIDGLHYISQELVEGETTLADRFAAQRERPGGDSFRELAELFARIADGLEAAHRAGVVHRDIKPGNLLIAPDGAPKIADFGLARIPDELGLSRTGELTGTPYYMSPEQALSQRDAIDGRSDVFSLGATLYEALALRRPFDGESSQQVIERILLDDPVDPRSVRARVPRDLAVICLKALEKKRERRYPSAAAFAADLRRWLADEPIAARAPSQLGRALRWSKRHPTLSASVAIASIALVALSALLVTSRAARLRAQAAELESAQALDLTKSLLSLADPDVRYGPPEPRGQLLARCTGRALALFAAEPARRADWLETAGKLLLGLGAPNEAARLLSAAADSSEGAFGAQDRRTLELRLAQGRVDADLDRFRDAEKALRSAWTGARSTFGEHDDLTDRALRALVLAFVREENRDRVLEFEPEITRIAGEVELTVQRLTLAGTRDERLFESLRDLARLRFGALDWTEAERRYAELGGLCNELRGPSHPDTLAARLGQIVCWNRLMRREEVVTALPELIHDAMTALGATHPTTLRARWRLAVNCVDLGDYATARGIYEDVIPEMVRVLGPDHLDTLKARTGWVITLDHSMVCDLALEQAEALHADLCAVVGQSHSAATTAARVLAFEYWAHGELASAERMLRETLEDVARAQGPGSLFAVETRNDLASLLCGLGRWEEARDLARQQDELTADTTEPSLVRWRAGLRDHLEELEALSSPPDVGEPALRAIVDTCAARFGPQSSQTTSARASLGSALLRWGRLEAGVAVLEPICDRSESIPAVVVAELGAAYLRLGDPERAERWFAVSRAACRRCSNCFDVSQVIERARGR